MLTNCKIRWSMLMMKNCLKKNLEKIWEKLSEDTVSFTIFGHIHSQENR